METLPSPWAKTSLTRPLHLARTSKCAMPVPYGKPGCLSVERTTSTLKLRGGPF